VAHQVHQVAGVFAVVDGEAGVEPDAPGPVAQQACADSVEGARPAQLGLRQPGPAGGPLRQDAPHAPPHLVGRAAREGEQQNARRVGAVGDQMRHAVRQRVGLARAGAGDHQQGRRRVRTRTPVHAMHHRRALRRIEPRERIGRDRGCRNGTHVRGREIFTG
jgi:hypothetical protein